MRFLQITAVAMAAALFVGGCVSVGPAPTVVVPTLPAISIAIPTLPPIPTVPPITLPPIPTIPPITLPPAPTDAPTLPPATTKPATTDAPATDGPAATGAPEHEKIQVADYQYVTMADAEWSGSGYREFFDPAEGNVLYAFLMDFEGIDPDGSSYNPLYFKLIIDGTEYTWYLFGKEPTLGSGDLAAGATAQGWLTFEAPLVDSVVLHYDPVMGMVGEPVDWTVTVNQ